ncbi:hypothetical protein PFICI_13028 [Pestalotiopsis fici W106-1]|uniref:C3H1-type domain-containing protein n=1 Tax=Pestalotiopsis fici (strain W106-1 / CGMCC3.15140) TaxID=1229662 RepID=W3WLA7_PESFW|nr:uncharacterized protein PFICI_13028 [Pestalotiopsis fici W106-1]ETS74544.1 hypothetical protein PFICI_13028 [Pestalotiopsis fici W106-1]
MDSSSLPTTNSPAIKAPSDVSFCSSGVSPASTRIGSPASSHSSSALLDLAQFTNSDIEPTSNTLLESQPTMERNAFQSVNLRRDKLIAERSNENNVMSNGPQAQRPFPLQQPQTLRPSTSTSISAQALRSLTSNNWRTQPLGEIMYNSFDPVVGNVPTPSQASRGPPSSFPAHSLPRLEQHAALMSYPNMAAFSDLQLDSCYAYCFDRGNGQYTQLIPADMLPTLQNVPALQQGCQGMIVLPTPRAFLSNSRSSNSDPILLRTPPATPGIPADNIQSRIDNIVATTPSTPTHHSSSASFSISHINNSHQQQHQGHQNTPSFLSSNSAPHHHHQQQQQQQQQPQRRPKVYCDKWVHEGVCAFTQQGCKYKHEMPFDKVTQHQLGLFHGLPAWWKKHQAELARQRDVSQTLGSEALSEGDNPGTNTNLGMNEVTPTHELNELSNRTGARYGTEIRGNFDDSVNNSTSAMAWRQQNSHVFGKNGGIEQSQHNRGGFTSRNGVGSQDLGSRANNFAWHPSPFGPIAPPPPRTSAQMSRSIASPIDGSLTTQGNLPTNNPYASLEALDDGKTD